jgi:DNA polymerase-2
MKVSTDIFILTGEWQDVKGQHLLRYYGISKEHGSVEVIIDNQKPLFFIPRQAALPPAVRPAERRKVPLRNFDSEEVDALYFHTQRALRQAANIFKRAKIPTFEADIKPDRRYLMERFINAQAGVAGEAVRNGKRLSFTNPQITPAEIIPDFTLLSLDIETGVDSDLLYSIAVHLLHTAQESSRVKNNHEKRVFMLEEAPGTYPEYIFFYPSQRELLEAFREWFERVDPDIIIGWNIVGFDLTFLERKCREQGVPFALSRNGRPVSLRKKERWGYVADISGRVVIDGPQALRGSFYTFEDYRLETVSQKLLGSGKTISSGDEDKIEEIDRLFREDKIALARYNLFDCMLVSEIFRKTGLLELYLRRAQISGMLLNQVGMSVAAFDHFFLPRLHRKGFVAPNAEDISGTEHAPGGYVMEPKPGIYNHVIVLDFKSLYPSIIQSFKIDPLSRLQSDINPLTTPKGCHFSSTEHILPEFIDHLMAQRALARRNGDEHLSQAIKILMNSFYGVMGSFGCRFYVL